MRTYWLTVATDDKGNVTGTGSVAQGVPAAITAKPDPGYHFTGWWVTSGSARITNSAADSTTVTLETGDATVKAAFSVNRYYLSINKIGSGTVTASDSVNHGAEKEINATPLGGWYFVAWRVKSGNASIADTTKANTTVSLKKGNTEIEAVFAINRYTLTLDNNGNGTVSPPSQTVTHSEADSISATPNTGHHFVVWRVKKGSASIAGSTKSATTVTLLNGDAEIEGVFAVNRYVLTLSCDENGNVSPASDTLDHGEADSITATPNTGYHFVGWSVKTGTASITGSAKAATTVTLLNGNTEVEAIFELNRYMLIMSKSGSGEVIPASDSVDHGKKITITATSTGSECQPFKVWRRSNTNAAITDSTAAATTVRITGNATVTAVFVTNFDTIYVDSAAKGTKTGVSWKQAFTDLHDALGCAEEGSVIFMAKGSYYPSPNDRAISFTLKNGVKVYGGFPPGGGVRNIEVHATILSGEIQRDGTKENNSRTIVKAANVDSTTRLDGVTVSDGYGDGEPGGGMDVVDGSMVIKACSFISNTASDSGGGMFLSGGEPVINACRFSNNVSDWGGAIFSKGNITLLGSIFSNNTSSGINRNAFGGAVYFSGITSMYSCSFTNNSCSSTANEGHGGALFLNNTTYLTNCSFVANVVTTTPDKWIDGGAIMALNCHVQLINCTFAGNKCINGSQPSGGAIEFYHCSADLYNCTIADNSTSGAIGSGGGICFDGQNSNDTLLVYNSIIYGNNAQGTHHQLAVYNVSHAEFYNINIQDGYTGPDTTDIIQNNLFTFDPLFEAIDTTTGPVPFIPIRLNSPAIDYGTMNVPAGVDISTDGRGLPRSDGRPDIGAYEVQ